eukprot:CAMPEP_0182419782 /NCGR_PEP_ID=MMETSP1167-20130531/4150_1 /TAXON_ID=2988 /ORGANISM="Mallomonas Sp, Strain CCMP3275" /LENGTH=704 /DNA_ID=CAMNT_0024594871 /DNA_START=42 /DNA_END=2156 /DNA_ORIENTATION=-
MVEIFLSKLLLLALYYISTTYADYYDDSNNDEYAVRFLVMGDWGTKTEGNNGNWNELVAAGMAGYAENYPADFLIALGDNFYNNGVESVNDELWDEVFTEIYDYDALQIPWYVVFGNHDYGQQDQAGSIDAQIEYTYDSRWNAGRCYMVSSTVPYSDPAVTVDIVFIDSTLLAPEVTYQTSTKSGISYNKQKYLQRQQLNCLEDYLLGSTADFLIVAGHYPIFTSGSSTDGEGGYDMLDTVYPLLDYYNVDMFLAGHEHFLEHLVYTSSNGGTMDFIISGAAGKPDNKIDNHQSGKASSQFTAATGGFSVIDVTEEGLTTKLVDYNGDVLYTTTRAFTRATTSSQESVSSRSSGASGGLFSGFASSNSTFISTLKYTLMVTALCVLFLTLFVDMRAARETIKSAFYDVFREDVDGAGKKPRNVGRFSKGPRGLENSTAETSNPLVPRFQSFRTSRNGEAFVPNFPLTHKNERFAVQAVMDKTGTLRHGVLPPVPSTLPSGSEGTSPSSSRPFLLPQQDRKLHTSQPLQYPPPLIQQIQPNFQPPRQQHPSQELQHIQQPYHRPQQLIQHYQQSPPPLSEFHRPSPSIPQQQQLPHLQKLRKPAPLEHALSAPSFTDIPRRPNPLQTVSPPSSPAREGVGVGAGPSTSTSTTPRRPVSLSSRPPVLGHFTSMRAKAAAVAYPEGVAKPNVHSTLDNRKTVHDETL